MGALRCPDFAAIRHRVVIQENTVFNLHGQGQCPVLSRRQMLFQHAIECRQHPLILRGVFPVWRDVAGGFMNVLRFRQDAPHMFDISRCQVGRNAVAAI